MQNQTLLSVFEPIRPGDGDMISGILPDASYVVGKAMKVSAVDADTNERTFAVADDDGFDGFLTRAVTDNTGPTVTVQVFPNAALETPFTHSGYGTITTYDELIVEGSDYLDASVVTGTAAEAELTFAAGKFDLAASTDKVYFKVVKELTPITAGNLRFMVKRVNSYVKA